MRINHNIAALNTYRQLASNQAMGNKSLEKLSSGLRINRAGDDAAGLAISEKMRGQIRGLNMASKNAQDGISLIQTAEGALQETHAILQRMRELAVQSSNDTNTEADRIELQKEVDQLAQELSRISNDTEFNNRNLVGGNFNGIFHIGSNEGQNLTLNIEAMDAYTLGVARDTLSGIVNDTSVIDSASFAAITGAAIQNGTEITVTYANNPSAVAATKDIGDVIFTAVEAGVTGNAISIEFVDPESNGASLGVTVDGNKITVNLATDGSGVITSTAAEIVAAINGDTDAKALVTASGSGTDPVSAVGLTNLDGGVDAATTITLTDNAATPNTQTINVNAEDTSVTVSDGAFAGLSFALADNKTLNDIIASYKITVGVDTASAATFGADGNIVNKANAKAGIDISTQGAADAAITTIQSAIDTVSAERSKLGAYQNRLEHTINNLGTSAENLTAAESRIRDVDMAEEMMEFTKSSILQQAATAMLAQANMAPQTVLQLLG